MSKEILFKVENRVAHIEINRPDKRNALNLSVLNQLEEAFARVNQEKEAVCALFYGKGDEAFCAGADLNELAATESLPARQSFFRNLARVLSKMRQCHVPIVAKVHGYALAGGCGLAAACDIVLASDEAKFGLPEVKIGLVPMVVMAPISRMIGKRALSYLVMSGETINAEEARAIGLITKVIPKNDLDLQASKFCESISKSSPAALKAARQIIASVGKTPYEQEISNLADRVAVFSLSEDSKEGIDAFLNKRSPKWS